MRRGVEPFGDSNSGLFSFEASSKLMIAFCLRSRFQCKNAKIQNLPNLENRVHTEYCGGCRHRIGGRTGFLRYGRCRPPLVIALLQVTWVEDPNGVTASRLFAEFM